MQVLVIPFSLQYMSLYVTLVAVGLMDEEGNAVQMTKLLRTLCLSMQLPKSRPKFFQMNANSSLQMCKSCQTLQCKRLHFLLQKIKFVELLFLDRDAEFMWQVYQINSKQDAHDNSVLSEILQAYLWDCNTGRNWESWNNSCQSMSNTWHSCRTWSHTSQPKCVLYTHTVNHLQANLVL